MIAHLIVVALSAWALTRFPAQSPHPVIFGHSWYVPNNDTVLASYRPTFISYQNNLPTCLHHSLAKLVYEKSPTDYSDQVGVRSIHNDWWSNLLPSSLDVITTCVFEGKAEGTTIEDLMDRMSSSDWAWRDYGLFKRWALNLFVPPIYASNPKYVCHNPHRLVEIPAWRVSHYLAYHGSVMVVSGWLRHARVINGFDGSSYHVVDSIAPGHDYWGDQPAGQYFGLVPDTFLEYSYNEPKDPKPQENIIATKGVDFIHRIDPVFVTCVITMFAVILLFHRPALGILTFSVPAFYVFPYLPLMFALTPLAAFAFVVWRVRNRFVHVVSHKHPIDVNATKDYFQAACREEQGPPSRPGLHLSLAHQRRFLEKACFELLFQLGYTRVRDIGGSRTRFPEYIGRKHICAAQNHNADILRDHKSDGEFDNCRMPGQMCPQRNAIPASIMSHVDYYMTPTEILQACTGPMFVINHQFDLASPNAKRGFGRFVVNRGSAAKPCHEEKYEATWSHSNGVIRMSAEDGTPYVHNFNKWGTEGEIVAGGKAAAYVRVAKYKDSNVYLVMPANGTYDSVGSLERSRCDQGAVLSTPRGPIVVTLNGSDYEYRNFAGDLIGAVPEHLVKYSVSQMSFTKRDEKYRPSTNSLVLSQLKAYKPELCAIADLVNEHVLVINNTVAARIVNQTYYKDLDPTDASYLQLQSLKVRDWIRAIIPLGLSAMLEGMESNGVAMHVARVMGVTHRVAAYEVYVDTAACELRGHKMKYRFRGGSPSVNAGLDGGAKFGATEITSQCSSFRRNESCQSGPTSLPDDHGSSIGNSSDDDASSYCSSFGDGDDLEDAGCMEQPRPAVLRPSVPTPSETGNTGIHSVDKRVSLDDQESDGEVRGQEKPKTQFSFCAPADECLGDLLALTNDGVRKAVHTFAHYSEPGPQFFTSVGINTQLTGDRDTGTVFVHRDVSEEELRTAALMLGALPNSVSSATFACALRWALSCVAPDLSPRCKKHNSVTCLDVRVHSSTSRGILQGYETVAVRGVGIQIPTEPTARTERSPRGGVIIRGPDNQGRDCQVFFESGNNKQDDGPAQHFTAKRQVPSGTRAIHVRPRTPDGKRVLPTKKSHNKPTNPNEGHIQRENARAARASSAKHPAAPETQLDSCTQHADNLANTKPLDHLSITDQIRLCGSSQAYEQLFPHGVTVDDRRELARTFVPLTGVDSVRRVYQEDRPNEKLSLGKKWAKYISDGKTVWCSVTDCAYRIPNRANHPR